MFWSRINFPDTIFTDLEENTLPSEGLLAVYPGKATVVVTTGKEKMYKDLYMMAGVLAILFSGM